jgi:hypothetical protein
MHRRLAGVVGQGGHHIPEEKNRLIMKQQPW